MTLLTLARTTPAFSRVGIDTDFDRTSVTHVGARMSCGATSCGRGVGKGVLTRAAARQRRPPQATLPPPPPPTSSLLAPCLPPSLPSDCLLDERVTGCTVVDRAVGGWRPSDGRALSGTKLVAIAARESATQTRREGESGSLVGTRQGASGRRQQEAGR
jgi:hypothetical protein